MEAAGLGFFMLSAGVFGTLVGFPRSPLHQALPDPFVRRALMGMAMGLTAIGIFYSPWGKQSGAHLNPVVTWTFFRLGKVCGWDALFYSIAQCVGGALAVIYLGGVFGEAFL
jgi:aquaporin Z